MSSEDVKKKPSRTVAALVGAMPLAMVAALAGNGLPDPSPAPMPLPEPWPGMNPMQVAAIGDERQREAAWRRARRASRQLAYALCTEAGRQYARLHLRSVWNEKKRTYEVPRGR